MFRYDDAVVSEFPTIRAGLVQARGLVNGPGSPELVDLYRAEQRSASDWLATTAIAELPSIAAWRRVFARFGAKPTQYRCAAEGALSCSFHTSPRPL
jgi:DNA/RNA-binding domain of Phe-tRNA-synthetase-like protein